MAIPSFGPSQRLELSTCYLESNIAEGKCERPRLYDRVDPRQNVAEEGQVVLLSNEYRSGPGSDRHKTEVVPDAAGYQIDCEAFTKMSKGQQLVFLTKEISKYLVGVNQVERGVRSPNSASGYGWDISVACNTGHPVTVRHTGSEKVHRFDLIGVRFPSEADMEAQADTWKASRSGGGSGGRGVSVCKFATYPVRENWEVLKYNRFVSDLHSLAMDVRHDYEDEAKHATLRYLQLPALLKMLEEFRSRAGALERLESESSCQLSLDALFQENVEEALQRMAMAATKFSATLVPPMLFAQCVSFQCVQPHAKSWAECGDLLNCVFL